MNRWRLITVRLLPSCRSPTDWNLATIIRVLDLGGCRGNSTVPKKRFEYALEAQFIGIVPQQLTSRFAERPFYFQDLKVVDTRRVPQR